MSSTTDPGPLTATRMLGDAFRSVSDSPAAAEGTPAAPAPSAPVSGPSEPADASEALRDVPPAERPSEALPRPIEPEDVRVGMLVERRNGECYVGGRVESIDGSGICAGKIAIAWIFGAKYAERGWTLWLVEDAPEPVDPDAELVERMAEAMWRIEENPPTDYAGAIDDPEGWQELARAALLALRETHVVTPRAEQ